MTKTITITSKDRNESETKISLSSFTEYEIATVTTKAQSLADMLFDFDIIDSEMHEIENAAIYDFLRFEEMD